MANQLHLPTLLLLACAGVHCASDPGPSATMSDDATGATPQTGGAAPAPGTGSTKPTGASGAPAAAANGNAAGSPAAAGAKAAPANGAGGTAAPSSNAGAMTASAGTNASSGQAGAGQAGDGASGVDAGAMAGTSMMAAAGAGGSDAPVPEPTDAPYVWGVGVGVSDVAAAVKFYTEVMVMTVEKENVQREDRVETVLASTKAGRGSRLVLMKYNDDRQVRNISAKLVWQAPSPSAINTAARMHPDYVSRLNIGIVQFDGPDTYIQEVGSSFDSGGAGIMDPYQVALGFSVSDQPKTIAFWEMIVGMERSPLGTFTVTDATGTGSIEESSLQIPTGGGSGLVPQTWTPMRNSKDNPVKVVLFVPDAQAVADKVMGASGTIVSPAARSDAYDNRLLVVAKDPDGYLVEIVQ